MKLTEVIAPRRVMVMATMVMMIIIVVLEMVVIWMAVTMVVKVE